MAPEYISSVLPKDIHIYYVDDILIASQTFIEHIRNIQWVFDKILNANLTLKYSKCHFAKPRIKFLSHYISDGGFSMDPEKTQAISKFPEPWNRKDLQSFIGFCNFYKKFSQNHSTLLVPLACLLKKGVPWEFGQSERMVFQEIKNVFSKQVSLTHPDFNKTFCVQTTLLSMIIIYLFYKVFNFLTTKWYIIICRY